MRKKIMIQCATRVNKSAIRRESINGIEHVIVSSSTLPDDIVMNGGLYPAAEIAKSFKTLERTLAPVEHPTDSNGNFLPASDPEAIHNFHAGAFNVNVKRENGRVHIEKHINVQEALKTDRGKRLMDRIEEIETNSKPRPIHTSVGLFLLVDELETPKTNGAGDQYTWVARDMFFDHDAILLDSVAAATPEKGVGIAVNEDGEKIKVDRILIENAEEDEPLAPKAKDSRINAVGPSFASISEEIQQAINGIVTADWVWLVDVFDTEAIFETPQGFFSVPYTMSNGKATIAGIPIRVDKKVEYQPKVNSQKGDGRMKELILNALADAGITTDGLSDDDLLTAYNELQVKGGGGGEGNGDITEAVANAIKPLADKVDAMATKLNAKDDDEIKKLVDIVINSKKYPGIDEAAAKLLPVKSLQDMAANCGSAHGVPFSVNDGDGDETFQVPADMPE